MQVPFLQGSGKSKHRQGPSNMLYFGIGNTNIHYKYYVLK